jgi:hypothetical protein
MQTGARWPSRGALKRAQEEALFLRLAMWNAYPDFHSDATTPADFGRIIPPYSFSQTE